MAGALAAQDSQSTVPSIGCPSDGQAGPVEAPPNATISAPSAGDAARSLAYYHAASPVGVFAPRGWHCFGTYGSNGVTLYVSPEAIDPKHVFGPGRKGFAGPAIQLSFLNGDTSGRFPVAQVIARVFPDRRQFVTNLMRDFDPPAGSIAFGPYASDMLRYKSKTVVEYRTPARAEGLGTYSGLEKDGNPIDGVAILAGETPDLLLLAVRLPDALRALTPAIVAQVERDAARLPN